MAKTSRPRPSLEDVVADLCKRVGKLEKEMKAMHEELKKQIKRIDEATNKVAARLDALAKQIEGGVSKDEAVAIVADLTGLADHLETIGANPQDPVPNPEPPAPNE